MSCHGHCTGNLPRVFATNLPTWPSFAHPRGGAAKAPDATRSVDSKLLQDMLDVIHEKKGISDARNTTRFPSSLEGVIMLRNRGTLPEVRETCCNLASGGTVWGSIGPHGDSSTDSGDALNLAGILNTLDGVVDTPGRLLVMTSNHPEKLDPALIRCLDQRVAPRTSSHAFSGVL